MNRFFALPPLRAVSRWSFLAGLVLFSACAGTLRGDNRDLPVYLTNTKAVHLLPPGAMEGTMDAAQTIEGSHGSDNFAFNAWVLATDSGLTVTLFSGMGTTLGTLRYSADSLFFESHVMDVQNMKPQYIVADFELSYFPTEKVRGMLSAAGLDLEESAEGDTLRRTISDRGTQLISIEKTTGALRYVNHLRGYEYHIHSVPGEK